MLVHITAEGVSLGRVLQLAFETGIEREPIEGQSLSVSIEEVVEGHTSIGVIEMIADGHITFPLTVVLGEREDLQYLEGYFQFGGSIRTAEGFTLAERGRTHFKHAS